MTAAPYADVIAGQSPAAWWRLDEPTGASSLTDSSGHGRTLPVAAGTHTRDGALSNDADTAAMMNGSTYYAADFADLRTQMAGAFSISAIVRVDSVVSNVDTGWASVATWYHVAPGEGGAALALRDGGTSIGVPLCYTDGTYDWIEVRNALARSTVAHVAATFDGDVVKLFLNGVLLTTGSRDQSKTVGVAAQSQAFEVGTTDDLRRWYGTLDEVAVWTHALTDAEVAAQSTARTATATFSDSYATAVTADSPALWWRMDAQTGATSIPDAATGTHPLTVAGTVTRVTGLDQDGTAIEVAAGTYLTATDTAGMEPPGQNLTYEAVIKATSVSGPFGPIVGRFGTYGYAGLLMSVVSDGRLRVNLGGTSSPAQYQTIDSAASGLLDGLPHHVAVTTDGTTVRLFIDGALDSETAQQFPRAAESSNGYSVATLADNPGNNYALFVGTLDEVAIYHAALSPSRVGAHYAALTGTMTDPGSGGGASGGGTSDPGTTDPIVFPLPEPDAAPVTRWHLANPAMPALATDLRIEAGAIGYAYTRTQGLFPVLGASAPVAVNGPQRLVAITPPPIHLWGDEERDLFVNVLASGATLQLTADTGESWWVIASADWTLTDSETATRLTDPKRTATVTFLVVRPPTGAAA